MKFTLMQDLLSEDAKAINISKALETSMLKDRKVIDQIAEKVQGEGFPEKFDLPVKTEDGEELVLHYELYEKSINDDKKSYHVVTFTYEYARETVVEIRAMLKKAEQDPSDEDGTKYDELHEELNANDIIHVMAEFGDKFTKVWGTNK
jgi:hypothetical protein